MCRYSKRTSTFVEFLKLLGLKDEYYFLGVCPVNNELRAKYLNNYFYRIPNVNQFCKLIL